MVKISIVMPVYNTEKYLSETLDAVLAQTFADFEVICVDDGSTDGSLRILEEYRDKDERIKIVVQDNQGVVAARNNAIALAKGEFIYPLDSDDVIAPNCLERLYEVITTTNNRVVASEACCFGEWNGSFRQPKFTKYEMYGWHEQCVVSALFYKEDFERFGGYRLAFNGFGGDDMDYWLNYMDNGMPMFRVKDCLFFYRQKLQQESVWKNYSKSEFKKRFDYKESMLRKYHPKMKKWVLLWKLAKMQSILFQIKRTENKMSIRLLKLTLFKVKRVKGKKLYLLLGFIPVWLKKVSSLFCYYFDSVLNFGDLLNQDLFNFFGKNCIRSGIYDADVMAIGSLLQTLFQEKKLSLIKRFRLHSKKALIVLGSGFISDMPVNSYVLRRLNVKAVRGYHSLNKLKQFSNVHIASDVAIGDPGLLSKYIVDVSKVEKKYDLGIIPHYVDKDNPLLRKIQVKNSIVIDVQQKPEMFLRQVAECRHIISSAMHGLVAADSLGIPNIRMVLSDKIIGGDYKYNDYYSAFGLSKHAVIDLSKRDFSEKDIPDIVGNYKIKIQQVEHICRDLIKVFPH